MFEGLTERLIKRCLNWAMDEIRDYIGTHGEHHFEQFKAYILALLDKADDQLFSAPAPPPGLDDAYCDAVANRFRHQLEEDANDA